MTVSKMYSDVHYLPQYPLLIFYCVYVLMHTSFIIITISVILHVVIIIGDIRLGNHMY